MNIWLKWSNLVFIGLKFNFGLWNSDKTTFLCISMTQFINKLFFLCILSYFKLSFEIIRFWLIKRCRSLHDFSRNRFFYRSSSTLCNTRRICFSRWINLRDASWTNLSTHTSGHLSKNFFSCKRLILMSFHSLTS